MYARIDGGEIVEVNTPTYHPIVFDGRTWDCRDPQVREEYIVAANWVPIVDTPQPPDTETETSDLTHELIEGVPTQVWIARPWTAEELTAREEAANEEQIGNKIETEDMPAMQAILDQTNANIRTDPSQEIKDLAKAVRRLDRKVMKLLDGTE